MYVRKKKSAQLEKCISHTSFGFKHVCNKLQIQQVHEVSKNKVLTREPGGVLSFFSSSLFIKKKSSSKTISSLAKYKKVISSLVKYFSPEDTKTISLENNMKLK